MYSPTLSIVTLILSAGTAFAQPPADPKPADALRGPAVSDRNVPGVNGAFGEAGGEKKRLINENRLPPRVFRDALQTIMGPDAPDALRVTDEQRTRYQGWMDDFQKSVSAYMREHRDELAQLRSKAGEPGGPGGRRPGAGGKAGPADEMPKPEGDPKETGAARERLQALMSGAPKIEDLYTRIWSELKPEQQHAVDAKIDEFRSQQAKEREDRYVREKTKKKNPPVDARPNGGATDQPQDGGPRGSGVDPQRRERLMRLFSQLSPEQQEQLLLRLERAREENGGKLPPPGKFRRGKGEQEGPGEPKPAPQPDDTMLPKPPAEPTGEPNKQP